MKKNFFARVVSFLLILSFLLGNLPATPAKAAETSENHWYEAVKDSVPVWSEPNSSKSSKTSKQIDTLSKGEAVHVEYYLCNSVGNEWACINKDGSAYVYMGNLTPHYHKAIKSFLPVTTYISQGVSTHKKNICTAYYCKCNEYVDREVVTVFEPHNFENGVCCECKERQIYSHTHETTATLIGKTYVNNGTSHTVTEELTYSCSTCFVCFPNEKISYEEGHYYDPDLSYYILPSHYATRKEYIGVCACGATKVLSTEPVENQLELEREFYQISENSHYLVSLYKETTETKCYMCETGFCPERFKNNLNKTTYEYGPGEEHEWITYYDFEYGVCEVCRVCDYNPTKVAAEMEQMLQEFRTFCSVAGMVPVPGCELFDLMDLALAVYSGADMLDIGLTALSLIPLIGAAGGYLKSANITHDLAKTKKVAKIISFSDDIMEAAKKSIDEFLDGTRAFDDPEVLDAYAKAYTDLVSSNKRWSWDDSIPGGYKLSEGEKDLIRQMAKDKGYIPIINVTKVEGMKFGFADFSEYAIETKKLPAKLWKASDKEQFEYLNKKIGGAVEGYVWHHTERKGVMELVPQGLHNVYTHNGGRTTGMWADAPR